MKASQFVGAQSAFILKQGNARDSVAEIYRKAGMSWATYFNWNKYDGLLPCDMRGLKLLEDENARLCKVVLDLTSDN